MTESTSPVGAVYLATTAPGTISVQLLGQGGVPASGVSAVAVTLTTNAAGGAGTATMYRSDGTNPNTPNIYFDAAHGVSNMVVTKVGADGKAKIAIAGASVDVAVVVQGWFSSANGQAGATFKPLDPTRIVDTRAATQTGVCSPSCSTMAANSTMTVQVTGRGGVPTSNVEEVALNITSLNASATGALFAYPTGQAIPPAPTVLHANAEQATELVFMKVSAAGTVDIFSLFNATDVLVDVVGWASPGATTGSDVYVPTDPARVLDTQAASGTCTPTCARMAANSYLDVQIASQGGVPASGVDAVLVTLTAKGASGAGMIQAWSTSGAWPTGLDLAYNAGLNDTTSAVVRLGTDGKIRMVNYNAATDVTIDVQGWYQPATNTWNYKYNPDGIRKSKTGPTGTTNYTWSYAESLPMLFAERTGTANYTYYIYGPGNLPLEQINPDGTTWYYHHDQLGSTRTITDTTGTTLATFSYDPYGKPSARTGTITPAFGYTGEYLDPETGYLYLRARYYDPTTGQFLTKDPLAVPGRDVGDCLN